MLLFFLLPLFLSFYGPPPQKYVTTTCIGDKITSDILITTTFSRVSYLIYFKKASKPSLPNFFPNKVVSQFEILTDSLAEEIPSEACFFRVTLCFGHS